MLSTVNLGIVGMTNSMMDTVTDVGDAAAVIASVAMRVLHLVATSVTVTVRTV